MQWNTFLYFCIAILLISSLINIPVLAATQGTVGQTYSTGSIAITLHIPESTRLIAHKSSQLSHKNITSVCLQVLDSVARSELNHYRVAFLDNQVDLQNEQALAESIKDSQLLQLRNYYGKDAGEAVECHSQHMAVNRLDGNAAQPVLLMLIAE